MIGIIRGCGNFNFKFNIKFIHDKYNNIMVTQNFSLL